MLSFIEALNLILDDKAADHDDFRNILISGNIDQRRITSLIKRQKISNIKFNVPNQEFSDLSECDSAGNLAAVFTNLEDGDIFILKYGNFQSAQIKEVFEEIIKDRKLSLVIGEGDAARDVKIDLPEFTLILYNEAYKEIDEDLSDLFPLKLIVGNHKILYNSDFIENNSFEDDTSNVFQENSSANMATLEFQIKRGVVDIDGCDDELVDLVQKCINLCENNKHDDAINLIKHLLYFEWSWSNCDGDPNDIFEEVDDVNFEYNDNWSFSVDVQDGDLIITANVNFNCNIKNDVSSEEIIEWLDNNSAYSCGYISGGWGYKSSDGDDVFLVKTFIS